MSAVDDNRHFVSIECNVPLDVAETILWFTLVYINALGGAKGDALRRAALGAALVHSMVALGKATNTPVENMRRASTLAVNITIAEGLKQAQT